MSSVFAKADVWDCKFPLCILPHTALASENIRHDVHRRVAEILAWSMQFAGTGFAPTVGEDGGRFGSAWRHSLAGSQLAGGWRMAYLGFKADMKARAEAHRFDRYIFVTLSVRHAWLRRRSPRRHALYRLHR